MRESWELGLPKADMNGAVGVPFIIPCRLQQLKSAGSEGSITLEPEEFVRTANGIGKGTRRAADVRIGARHYERGLQRIGRIRPTHDRVPGEFVILPASSLF
jgi:hypothetical protein